MSPTLGLGGFKGGVSSIVLTCQFCFCLFILALLRPCTPFTPPSLIIDGHPCLAVFTLPHHFCCDTIVALPLPCLCWSGAIIPSPLSCQRYRHIRTAATTATTAATAICLSYCHRCQRTSLVLDTSSLAILANADVNVVI